MIPYALLTADWHLTRRTPSVRTDDYWQTMQRKVRWIVDKANELGVPILHAGDIFDRPTSPPEVERFLIEELRRLQGGMLIVAGNHDTPFHDLEQLPRSSYGVILSTLLMRDVDQREVVYRDGDSPTRLGVVGAAWGRDMTTVPPSKFAAGLPRILLAHHLVGGGEDSLWLKEHATEAKRFLRRTEYDLILTGHNHQTFVAEHEGRFLVNPGSIMRASRDQRDHEPSVFVWGRTRKGYEVEQLPIPVAAPELVGFDRPEEAAHAARRSDIEAFVEQLKQETEAGVSFVANLERYLEDNNVSKDVTRLVWELVGG